MPWPVLTTGPPTTNSCRRFCFMTTDPASGWRRGAIAVALPPVLHIFANNHQHVPLRSSCRGDLTVDPRLLGVICLAHPRSKCVWLTDLRWEAETRHLRDSVR